MTITEGGREVERGVGEVGYIHRYYWLCRSKRTLREITTHVYHTCIDQCQKLINNQLKITFFLKCLDTIELKLSQVDFCTLLDLHVL